MITKKLVSLGFDVSNLIPIKKTIFSENLLFNPVNLRQSFL